MITTIAETVMMSLPVMGIFGFFEGPKLTTLRNIEGKFGQRRVTFKINDELPPVTLPADRIPGGLEFDQRKKLPAVQDFNLFLDELGIRSAVENFNSTGDPSQVLDQVAGIDKMIIREIAGIPAVEKMIAQANSTNMNLSSEIVALREKLKAQGAPTSETVPKLGDPKIEEERRNFLITQSKRRGLLASRLTTPLDPASLAVFDQPGLKKTLGA